MKKIPLFIAILAFFASAPLSHAAFSYYRTVTINHSTVASSTGSETYTNFPVFVSLTTSTLATTGNGGHVQNASGYDIGFYSNADCSTGKLNWEIESSSYSASAGAILDWVKVPSVSTTTDTTFYLCYGDATISTDQSSETSTWSNSYNGVWHFANGTNLDVGDSVNPTNGFSNFGPVTSASGVAVDGAASSSNSNQYINVNDLRAYDTPSAQTVSIWIKAKVAPQGAWATIMNKHATNNPPYNNWVFDTFSSGAVYEYCVTNNAGGGPSNGQWCVKSSQALDTNLHKLDGTYNGSVVTLYLDGTAIASTSASISIATSTNPVRFFNPDGGVQNFNGYLDEARLQSVARSADWIKTDFNQVNVSSTFLTVGTEQTVGGGGATSTPKRRYTMVLIAL